MSGFRDHSPNPYEIRLDAARRERAEYDSGDEMTRAEFEQRYDDIIRGGIETRQETGRDRSERIKANYRQRDQRTDGVPEIQGTPNEPLQRGQKVSDWFRRAQDNGVTAVRGKGFRQPLSAEGHDHDWNRYWGERFGFAKESAETRGLLEDTAGSAQAITPMAWVSDYIDVLLPNTILGKVGFVTVPMSEETVTVPIFSSTVSPSWIAEAGSISLDANPAYAPLTMFSPGGFKDVTLFSAELAQDAFIAGNLDGMLAEAVMRKMQVVLDTSMLLGVTSNTGIPGLINETGTVIRHYTGDAGTTGKAPTDTTELGVIVESVMKKNAMPNSFVSNVGVREAFRRIPLATYGKYFDDPPITEGMEWVTSENSALPYVETDPATASSVAQTGGSYGSVYCGPWNRFAHVGIHLDLQTVVLKERYLADTGNYGLFSFCRYSIRFAHPETFVRTIGIIPV